MISLWITAILAVFALGLAHRAALSLQLARYQRDRLQVYCLVKAKLNQAIVLIKEKADNFDNWMEEIDPQSGFTIVDEGRKINLTGLGEPELKQLFLQTLKDLNEEGAANLAKAVIKWITPQAGGEEQGTLLKREPFVIPEELLLVLEDFYKDEREPRQKAQAAFSVIKDLITIYPPKENMINVNTVPADGKILTLFADILADDAERECAGNLAGAIIKQRNEAAKQYFENKEDIVADSCPGSANLLGKLKPKFIVKSNYFRVRAQADVGKVSKTITAIYTLGNGSVGNKAGIVYWHEN